MCIRDRDNDHIITGLGCGESRVFFRNLHKIADKVRNVTVTNCLPVENYEFFMNPEYNKNILSNTWFYSAGPVSYTHLDVYKRQTIAKQLS